MGFSSRAALCFTFSILAVVIGTQAFFKDFSLKKALKAGLPSHYSSGKISTGSMEAIIPLERLSGVWVARVEVNDLYQTRMIVDTGATFTTISEDFAFDAGIQHGGGNSNIKLMTAGGDVQAELSVLENLRVGNVGRENVRVVIHTIPNLPEGISGLLGLSFFDRFLVRLDQSAQELHLTPKL